MIERFLTDVVGVPWDDVHEEAEQLEHAMTPRFEAYVRASVGDAKTCPHGHPIRVGERIDGVPLADCEPGAKVTIPRPRRAPRCRNSWCSAGNATGAESPAPATPAGCPGSGASERRSRGG
jgi:hypothetical protein